MKKKLNDPTGTVIAGLSAIAIAGGATIGLHHALSTSEAIAVCPSPAPFLSEVVTLAAVPFGDVTVASCHMATFIYVIASMIFLSTISALIWAVFQDS